MVAKLFNIFTPERAFFGQKDAAQVAVLRKMVRDFGLLSNWRCARLCARPMGWR